MKIEDLRGKKIAILGFGVEGFSTARFFARNNIPFSILEKKKIEELEPEVQDFVMSGKYAYTSGPEHLERLTDFEVIFRTPGFPLWHPKIIEAKERGVEITSHTKLFFDLCPCPIIGVTGTKGKGTTATLIHEMLKESGFDVFLGGNIGRPPLDFLSKLCEKSWVVLELSSFQLEDLTKSPHLAVVLMTTQEHLNSQAPESPNYHRTVEEYCSAKKNIVCYQNKEDLAVVNHDYESSRRMVEGVKSQVYFFSTQEKLASGSYLDGDQLVTSLNGSRVRLCSESKVFIRGEHNLQNILAAATAALMVGAERSKVVEVIKTFKGLEHRLEFVREIGGVKYYNDSFSTTPETAMAAIKAFAEPETLILGGSEKGSDYEELGRLVATAINVRAVLLIGVTSPKIKKAINQDKTRTVLISLGTKVTMAETVGRASRLAKRGEVVLLSPACASFDMFKNYKDRGLQFKEAVNKL